MEEYLRNESIWGLILHKQLNRNPKNQCYDLICDDNMSEQDDHSQGKVFLP